MGSKKRCVLQKEEEIKKEQFFTGQVVYCRKIYKWWIRIRKKSWGGGILRNVFFGTNRQGGHLFYFIFFFL